MPENGGLDGRGEREDGKGGWEGRMEMGDGMEMRDENWRGWD